MTVSDAELLDLARTAAGNAYAPYSGFPVGAALLLDDGRTVTGCNVENASYGLTVCAERTAAGRMIAEREGADGDGCRPHIVAAAVVGLKASPCHPCGACRQVLGEFSCERVIVEGPSGDPVSIDFRDLLPHAFGPDSL
ncbi:cytidine deaminase [Corynebacterium sp. P7202]|uniref:Cytidine deaminase n=1 Tax=Corynebacterium pygosceleis TaxID=2800406 RepID=A0A9Q4C9H9_9CORY|nr:cytidine deaminase [Corynebacterium pygosceleis]MCK7636499.1 cytidine deaminase [Corynebacterium pygosceleis]MCX7469187.1 cytidine deaminase [Corynebacterium pygosceleis]